jgi:hypothetical protein
MLSSVFPGGSARNEIRRRVLANSESGDSRQSMISAVIEEIVQELVAESKKMQTADESKRVKLSGHG